MCVTYVIHFAHCTKAFKLIITPAHVGDILKVSG